MESFISPTDVTTVGHADLAFKIWFYWNFVVLVLFSAILVIVGVGFQKSGILPPKFPMNIINAIVIIILFLSFGTMIAMYYGWNYFVQKALTTTDDEKAHKQVIGLVVAVCVIYGLMLLSMIRNLFK